METNNKLRKALEEIDKNTDLLDIAENIAPKLHPSHSFVAVQIRKIVRAALAKPPRNCDVGTLTEQQQRFRDFCEKMQHTDKACCGGCPIVHLRVKGIIGNSCEIAWAQMPYEEGDKS